MLTLVQSCHLWSVSNPTVIICWPLLILFLQFSVTVSWVMINPYGSLGWVRMHRLTVSFSYKNLIFDQLFMCLRAWLLVIACAYLTCAVRAHVWCKYWVLNHTSCVSAHEQAKSILRGRKAIWYESVISDNHNCSCCPLMWWEFNHLTLRVLGKTFWWEMDVLLQ